METDLGGLAIAGVIVLGLLAALVPWRAAPRQRRNQPRDDNE